MLTFWRSKKVKKGRQFAGKPAITTTGTHMPYGITQCYLPPGRGDIPVKDDEDDDDDDNGISN